MTLSSNKEQWKQRWLASCSITCVDLELVRTQSINYPDGTLYGLLRRWILIWYLIWRYDGTFARWRYEISAIKIDWSSRQTPQWCLGVNKNYFWGHITHEFDKFYIGSFINYTGWQKCPIFCYSPEYFWHNVFVTKFLWIGWMGNKIFFWYNIQRNFRYSFFFLP